jgi:hypothetical protein
MILVAGGLAVIGVHADQALLGLGEEVVVTNFFSVFPGGGPGQDLGDMPLPPACLLWLFPRGCRPAGQTGGLAGNRPSAGWLPVPPTLSAMVKTCAASLP